MKDNLEREIRDLIKDPKFELLDKDFETFKQIVKGMVFEAGTHEMAIAFVTIAVMDKNDVIVSRNNRKEDIPLLINIALYVYRNKGKQKSTLLLIHEALNLLMNKLDLKFRELVILKTEFDIILGFIRPPLEPQTF